MLGGALGAAGLALAGFALFRDASHGVGEYSIVFAAIASVIGTTLYVIGHAIEQALEDRDDD